MPATLEGELRFTHSRLLENAEEVALYHGEEFEKNVIERGYFALIKHVNSVLRVRVWHSMAEEGVIKWVWGSLGLCICAIPVFAGEMLGMKAGDLGSRTEGELDGFVVSQLMVRLRYKSTPLVIVKRCLWARHV